MENKKTFLQSSPCNPNLSSAFVSPEVPPLVSNQFRRLNQNVKSLPRNYGSSNDSLARSSVALIASSVSESYSSEISHPHNQSVFGIKLIRSRCSEPNMNKFNETFPCEATAFLSNDFMNPRTSRVLPGREVGKGTRRRQACSAFSPRIATISSVDGVDYSPEDASDLFKRRLMKPSSMDSPDYNKKPCDLTQAYFNKNLNQQLISRAHSLIVDDQIIDVEYDSDIGWRTKSIRQSPFKRLPKISNSREKDRERTYSRELLKLDLKTGKNPHRMIPSSPKAAKHVDSIVNLIDDVRSKLVLSPKKKFATEVTNNATDEIKKSKAQLEGKVVSPKLKQSLKESTKESSDELKQKEVKSGDDEMIDEVFDSPLKSKNSVPIKNKKETQNLESIASTLEAMKSKSRNNSVRIKEKPDRKTSAKSNKIASSHAIANLQTKPPRGSLKKSSTDPSSSDYDRDRGRSRHIEGGHRESFKKNDRTNDRGGDQDRDASDREHKDGSLNRSLSNTDTNLEDRIGLLTIKAINTRFDLNLFLDGSLSDTAVGLSGLDSRRGKQMDQRSPKSETPTRDRDRFGASSGMGKKSNSTSQLSATGNLSKSLSIPLPLFSLI